MSEKASFYAKDPGERDALVKEQAGEKAYTGPERRRDNRRKAADRRTEVRFEINKDDRRQLRILALGLLKALQRLPLSLQRHVTSVQKTTAPGEP